MDAAMVERFVKRLPRSGVGLLDCWLMKGRLNTSGYAKYGDRKSHAEIYAHRIVAHEVYGPIQAGLEVDHLCGVRHCVNPLHLRVCSLQENRARRRFVPKTHCKHGHALVGHNVYIAKNGSRTCRTCRYASNARWLAKQLGA